MVYKKKLGSPAFLLIILILSVAGFGVYSYLSVNKPENVNYAQVNVTKENFASILASNSFVRELPDDAVISLVVGEEYYTMKKASVSKGQATDYDFQLSIPDRYIPMLGNLCSAVQTAKSNGDLGFDSSMSKTSLLWKYKSSMKYKGCFGL